MQKQLQQRIIKISNNKEVDSTPETSYKILEFASSLKSVLLFFTCNRVLTTLSWYTPKSNYTRFV